MATRMLMPRITMPARAFPSPHRVRSTRPATRRPPGTGTGTALIDGPCSSTDPWVEADVGQVDDEDGHQQREREDQEERLHQRVVVIGDRDVEQVAEAWIAVDTLDEHRATHHGAE